MSGEEPAPQMAPVETPQMISTVKLPMLKKGEYTFWSMRMKQYLTNTYYGLWQVIMNSDKLVQTTKDENGVETEVPPKTAQALLQRQKERKAKSILLLAIPDEYQLRFHTIKDAKSLWADIKIIFGGNVESKKMQKNKMPKESVLRKGIGHKEVRPIWNNTQRINHQNKFVPTAILTRSERMLESTAKQNVNTATPKNRVNVSKSKINTFPKSHSPIRRPFSKSTVLNTRVSKEKVNTVRVNGVNTARQTAVSTLKGNGVTAVKASVFVPVARVEAIRIFLAFASFMNFCVYQMDVKSAFFYGTIKGEVYVCQPPGFVDPEFPKKVYKVEKTLYGLHQAPRAWYETLSTYLLDNGFHRGQIDKTFFIKRLKGDILLVQVYVDDIIFGSTKKSLCDEFEHIMHNRFQMSSMGELTFFLALQVKQKEDGIFISEDNVFESGSSDGDDNQTNDRPTTNKTSAMCSEDSQTTVKPSFKRIEFTKARNEPVKSDKQAVKPRMVTQSPKKMPKESVLRKGTGHKEVRPIWNNTQRINHQNKFVPTVVLTRVSKEKVNIVRVNGVNTAGQTTVSTVKGNGVTAVKASAGRWRSQAYDRNKALLLTYQHIDGGFVALVKVLEVKNNILFTETECLVLSPDFKLIDESQVLLRVPRQNNMYSFDLKNVVPSGDLTCLFAKATIDESKLLHRRLGHVNFKIINKLVKGNLVRCLPSKTFENDHTCVACQKGKQHKASCTGSNLCVHQPTFMLLHWTYWTNIWIKREYSVARTPQQNGVAKRKNRTLIEVARTMLVDSLLPTVFWAEFDGKDEEGFFVGFSINSRLFRREATEQSDAVRKSLKLVTFSLVGPSSGPSFVPFGESFPIDAANLPHDPLMPKLEDTTEIQSIGFFGNAYDDHDLETLNTPYADQNVGAEANFNNMEPFTVFKIQKVWTIVDLPSGKKAIGTKWMFKVLFSMVPLKRRYMFANLQYESLSTYLLDNGFHKGQIDKTLFIKRLKGDILLVQVYVDDIIFSSTKKSLCDEFEQIMHNRLQMSSMGELTFFFSLQVKQKEDGIFISQDKYVGEILKKFGFSSVRTASTPMETNKALTKDEDGEDVDVYLYKSMIGSLMSTQLGLWYPKDSPLILEAFSDSDYAGASLDRKSTTGGCQFLGSRLISWQCKKQNVVANSTTKAEYIDASHCYGQVLWIQNQISMRESGIEMVKIHTDNNVADLLTKAFDVSRFNFLVASIGKRGRDTKIPQSGGPPIKVGDEAVHKELNDRIEKAATTASSFEAEQDSGSGPRYILLLLDEVTTVRLQVSTARPNLVLLDRVHAITATIDGRDKIISKASIRRHLKLQDSEGLSSLPNAEIFKQLASMGTYSTPTLTNKLFNNMRRASKGYSGVVTPLFDTMLVQPQGEAPSTSPSRITSSPSLSSHHTTCSTPTTPPSIQITYEVDETAIMPHDSHLLGGYTPGSDEGRMQHTKLMELITKLIDRIKALEKDLQSGKEDIETQKKNSVDTEVLLEETTPTELIEDKGSGEKGEKEISTANVPVSTAGAEVSTASHDVSTIAAALVYIRRSASKAKDKGKAIMQEPEPPKKLKKRV
ncbi:putative ribonuclease H-like domain-containing protein [Tanacetum coccineum]